MAGADTASCDSLFWESLPGYSDKTKSLQKIIESSGKSIAQKEGLTTFRSNFTVGRGITEYSRVFGDLFASKLAELDRNDVVMDPGGGDAHLSDYMIAMDGPKYMGVTYELLQRKQDYFSKQTQAGRLKIITGKFFEDIQDMELKSLGSIKLITDLYGVMSYSAKPDVVLKKYLDLLDADGIIFIFGPKIKVGKDYDHFLSWLRSIKGIEVTRFGLESNVFTEYSYSIRRTEELVEIPEFEFVSSSPGMPPTRSYRYSGKVIKSSLLDPR